MNERVARLEVNLEHVRQDIGEIKTDLKTAVVRLGELPTKRDMHTYSLTGIALGLAVIAIVIGGIVGGISFIAARQGTPQIMFVPSPQSLPPAKSP